jgi:hypothetical protein
MSNMTLFLIDSQLDLHSESRFVVVFVQSIEKASATAEAFSSRASSTRGFLITRGSRERPVRPHINDCR